MRAIPPSELLILTGEHVRRLMPMADCIPIVERAMRTVSAGKAALPLRIAARIPHSRNLIATMPGYLAEPASLGAKVIAVYPENTRRGLSSHMEEVLVLKSRFFVDYRPSIVPQAGEPQAAFKGAIRPWAYVDDVYGQSLVSRSVCPHR